MAEARKHARLFDLARSLGLPDLQQNLTLGAKDQNEVYVEFILNLLILRHEAERLGIRPTQTEIITAIHGLQAFQGQSGFDLKKYDDFVQNALAPNGMSEAQIEDVVRDDLSLKRVKQLLSTGIAVSESVSKENFDEAYGKLNVRVVRLHGADVAKEIKVSDDDTQKYFEAHKAEYKTDEKRKVDFVKLTLTDEQKKLTGKDRIDPLQKLSDRANDVSQALLEKGADFKTVAAKFQIPVNTTGEFTANAADPQLKDAPQVTGIAFKLTQQDPNSDPIQVSDGFYILHLTNVVESRPLTLEEAKPKAVEALKRNRSRELLSTKGTEIANQLREALKSGQPLDAAVQKAGIKAERIPPFSLMDEPNVKPDAKDKNEPPDFMAIKNATARLSPGEVSDFMPWEDGGLVALMEKRDPADAETIAKSKSSFDERYLGNKRDIVFFEWLRDRQHDAGLTTGPAEPAGPGSAPPPKKS
jgi:peptidyl-prolyl cis-trans isomerase D